MVSPLLADAAMGTALPRNAAAPSFNLKRPELVLAVHREHVLAGAQMVLTNTFAGASAEEAAAALRLARESGAQQVAASLWAGLNDLRAQIAQLEKADIVWLETATSAEQALHAVRLARETTLKPVFITCAMRRAPLDELRAAGAAAAGYNCAPWPADLEKADIWKPDAAGLSPDEWARTVAEAKVRIKGGCCGTGAPYLAALRATLR